MHLALVTSRPGRGWGHSWYGGSAWLWTSLVLVVLVALTALAVWLVMRSAARRAAPTGPSGIDRARDLLAERYARGEISTEEYHDRLSNLSGTPGTAGTAGTT
ncbi:hypothetical protein [Spongiactinospora sp. TRM90649]|uniref:hypothetical protein n=1 Tax=Spongiactinospora sp. TRM90649 TaxID=3031114 RepID=UPI0023F85AD8|nr:hypothetical protein [Spongiactinospora sp. TRM90649]MDF5752851.1 hypothetical protein [Spongiactinospora sp. TRM90649]